jgi:16S rRNA (cytosine1402-N4)-methyltransferase
MPVHEPVMAAEVVAHLEPARGGVFVDCTVGLGGHARTLLDGGASRLIGFDRDASALSLARSALAEYASRLALIHDDYRRLDDRLDELGIAGVDGILADLGVSSMQLDEPGRGFSFRRDEPLDLRMDRTTGRTVAEALRDVDEADLADVIFRFGEERYSRRIARAIVRSDRPVETTGELAALVRRAVPYRGYSRIDPATRTFQALRIWINRELEGLDVFVQRAARRLNPGGRLVMLTFHSLEDRVVKHTLRALQADPSSGITLRTRRPEVPGEEEVARNPRARSAKLRAAERTGVTV